MEQIQFKQEHQDNVVLQILDEFISELFEENFKLVTYEREQKYEEVEITNTAVFSWLGLDRKKGLIQENERVREQVTNNYEKLILALNK